MCEGILYAEKLNYYRSIYKLGVDTEGVDIVIESFSRFHDSERVKRFLNFIKCVRENNPGYNKIFDEIYKDYSISQAS